ncbi:hypothetical protein FKW77_001552 [Venturia effusa]|uniref:Uncharacterized protein n=1 Tax=Venturia effusa TaxID=50376 RepID=A0A517LD82_9PEZI|nr:hypothetical protein FKW77_001552 [Venturia effusa]
MSALPVISDVPRHHPDCCLSLSTRLVWQIGQHHLPGSTIISIGSGSGLLEALLQEQYPRTRVIGVEVNDMVNKYLSPGNSTTVKGTWDIYDKSSKDDTWLFVYPRSSGLISRYLQLLTVPRSILWLGPRKDWEEFRSPFLAFGDFGIEEIGDAGLASYETMFVMKREDLQLSEDTAKRFDISQIDDI